MLPPEWGKLNYGCLTLWRSALPDPLSTFLSPRLSSAALLPPGSRRESTRGNVASFQKVTGRRISCSVLCLVGDEFLWTDLVVAAAAVAAAQTVAALCCVDVKGGTALWGQFYMLNDSIRYFPVNSNQCLPYAWFSSLVLSWCYCAPLVDGNISLVVFVSPLERMYVSVATQRAIMWMKPSSQRTSQASHGTNTDMSGKYALMLSEKSALVVWDRRWARWNHHFSPL